MPLEAKRKLFVVIQPLQYLQALELFEDNEERILIALWADKNSQLHKLVCEDDWDQVIWLEYSGTALDILKHHKKIKSDIRTFGNLDEVVISAYYNEFMNLIANAFPSAKKILLEDGNATLTLDDEEHYNNLKFGAKKLLCYIYGFDIRPVENLTLFILDRPEKIAIPKIASGILVNTFKKLREEVRSYEQHNSVLFISSSFIDVGMIEKTDYINFLICLANKNAQSNFDIILHRFDKKSDFSEVLKLKHVNIIESTGPIEIYFKEKKYIPKKIISAGSGATETLELIYGIEVEIAMPKLSDFFPQYRKELESVTEHLSKSHKVEFL